jgi:hypothetical protein
MAGIVVALGIAGVVLLRKAQEAHAAGIEACDLGWSWP